MPDKLPRSLETGRSWGRTFLRTLDLQRKDSVGPNGIFPVIDPNFIQADAQPRQMTLSGIMQSATDAGLIIPSGAAGGANIAGGSGIYITTSGNFDIINAVPGGNTLEAGSGIYFAASANGESINVNPDELVFDTVTIRDNVTTQGVELEVRNGALTVTDPATEVTSAIDLGGTTPDPGHLVLVEINGAGQYQTGTLATQANNNGLLTLEYVNGPGQFFVITDIGGPGFGPGDRQGFGLVRETLVDQTDLDGGAAPLAGGMAGGWSLGYYMFYTGGFPYIWTTYTDAAQTPAGAGNAAAGTFSGQSTQRDWWEACILANKPHTCRWGIADGENSDQSGQNFGNRLIAQFYVYQEMLDTPAAAAKLPAAVITNGEGYYTCYATGADYENMGQFPDGQDKGYRFRWSTFGRTTLTQLPFLQGVPTNDQITTASGLSHYVVYNCDATDKAAANSVMATGATTANNPLQGAGVEVVVLQFNQPYDFPNTPAGQVFELNFSYVSAVTQSPIFVNYDIDTVEDLRTSALAVQPLQNLHQLVCDNIVEAVTAYYLIRNLNQTNTAEAVAYVQSASTPALGGQLRNTYYAVDALVPDDNAPAGTGGVVLFPQVLKDNLMETLSLWQNTLPDN